VEFIVQNKDDNKIYDFSNIVSKPEYTTELNNGAGKLSFEYLKQGVMLAPGSIVRFKDDTSNIFYGYIFPSKNSDADMLSATAYDQLRYFKYKDSIMVNNYSVSKLTTNICNKQKLKYGSIEETGYNLGDVLYKGKTYLDMVYSAISDTLVATKKKYILYDDYGSISLKEANNLRLPLIIGDESLAYGYDYERSIDGETYNKIKIAKKSVDSSDNLFLDQTVVAEDLNNQAKWGILQYYEEVDANTTEAVRKQRATDLLKLYNAEEKKLSIKCLGDSRVKAGTSIRVILSNLMIDQYFIVKRAVHYYYSIHTMDLELIL